MGQITEIGWTDCTFNPFRGCTKISPGCTNCYAETMSHRNPKVLGVWGDKGTRVVASESMWREPVKWDAAAKAAGERRRVFCASLADVFEDWTGRIQNASGRDVWVSKDTYRCWETDDGTPGYAYNHNPLTLADVRERLFKLIGQTPNLDWLLLTKRPENIERLWPRWADEQYSWPPNVWLGVSVENQTTANERIPILLRIPAAVRWLSCEPLLSPVDLTRCWVPDRSGWWNALDGRLTCKMKCDNGQEAWIETVKPITKAIGWAVAGGESGPHFRECDPAWIVSLARQCQEAGVPCFVKQDSGRFPGKQGRIPDDVWALKEFPGEGR